MTFNNEQIKKAMECKNADELLALAKEEGIEMTADEAEKYMSSLNSAEIKADDLDAVSGGFCEGHVCGSNC